MERSGTRSVAAHVLRYAWLVFVVCLLAMSVLLSVAIFQNQTIPNSKYMDFTVFWTAAGFDGNVYDVTSLTAAQADYVPSRWELRPFSYPPSTLLALQPLQLLSYDAALYLWTAAGIAAFAVGACFIDRKALAGFAFLPVGMALLAGQLSLFLAGAMAAAIALLDKKPVTAGMLLGLVAAIKPQIAILLPVALIAGSHWKAIFYAGGTFSLLILASLGLGPHLWVDWIHGLPQFVEQTSKSPYRELNIARGPTYAPLGIALVAIAFRYAKSPAVKLLSLTVGTVLSVPYMLVYDLAVGCPALAAVLLRPMAKRAANEDRPFRRDHERRPWLASPWPHFSGRAGDRSAHHRETSPNSKSL